MVPCLIRCGQKALPQKQAINIIGSVRKGSRPTRGFWWTYSNASHFHPVAVIVLAMMAPEAPRVRRFPQEQTSGVWDSRYFTKGPTAGTTRRPHTLSVFLWYGSLFPTRYLVQKRRHTEIRSKYHYYTMTSITTQTKPWTNWCFNIMVNKKERDAVTFNKIDGESSIVLLIAIFSCFSRSSLVLMHQYMD